MDEIREVFDTDILKKEAGAFVENAIGMFTKDPAAVLSTVQQIRNLPSTIRDGIYWENFSNYLLHVYDFDKNTGTLRDYNKRKLAELLAEQSPNAEAGYLGNPEMLRENVKRLVKLIDDAGTIQKSIYYANLTRAALNDHITRKHFLSFVIV